MRKRMFYTWLSLLSALIGILPVNAQNKISQMSNLVCFVRFHGEPEMQAFEKPFADYEKFFNDASPGANSVLNYFKEVSYQQLTWESSFFPIAKEGLVVSYETKLQREYYKEKGSLNEVGYSNDVERAAREQALIKEIAQYLSKNLPDDVNLDSDGNNIIDNMCIILSGRSELSNRHLLWPHRSDLALPDEKAIYIKDKKLTGYIMVFDDANGWEHLNPIPLNTGVLCHEMSHSLGTYDLYHVNDNLNPVGVWDLMSDNLLIPQHMSVYTKYRYCGWIEHIPEITEPGTYTLSPVGGKSKENIAYKIKPIGSDEYFIVEYRKKEGTFDQGLPESGLLIYRINPLYTGGNLNYNGSTRLDEVYIFRPGGTLKADGDISKASFSKESGRTMFGGDAEVKPFYSDGTTARFMLSNISSCGETISFEYSKLSNQLKLSKHEIILGAKIGEKQSLTVESDVAWKISELAEWLKVDTDNGEAGKTTITFETVTENKNIKTRDFDVVFTSPADLSLTTHLNVCQQSGILLPPEELNGQKTPEGGICLSWTAPNEGKLILSDGFENTENPNGWKIINAGDRGWNWQESNKYYEAYSGNYSVYMKSAWEDVHQDEWLISPEFSNGKNLTLYSKSIAPQKNIQNQFYEIVVSNDGGHSWQKVYDLITDCDKVNEYVKISVDLSEYQSENMKVAFHAYDTNNTGLSYWWQIDNINIYASPETPLIKTYAVYRNGIKIGESEDCTFFDEQPLAGENIYSIRAVTSYGETSDSKTITLYYDATDLEKHTADAQKYQIILSAGQIQIHSANAISSAALYAIDGTLLQQKNNTTKQSVISLQQPSKGIYMLHTCLGNQKKQHIQKIMIP